MNQYLAQTTQSHKAKQHRMCHGSTVQIPDKADPHVFHGMLQNPGKLSGSIFRYSVANATTGLLRQLGFCVEKLMKVYVGGRANGAQGRNFL
jgi:hypothetical protein